MNNLTAITIKDLKVNTIIGVLEKERKTPQRLSIDVLFYLDDREAALTDDLEKTVNYFSMEDRIYRAVKESAFYLLEKLSDYILDIIMEERMIKKAAVSIRKPEAMRYSKYVMITKERERK